VEAQKKIDDLGRAFGWPWIPVKFHSTAPAKPAEEKRFCEAIWDGRATPIVLTADSVTCPGAKRSFGWSRGMDEGLAEKLSRNQGVTLATAKRALKGIPFLGNGTVAVEVGTLEVPDVLVSFAQPVTLMKLARAYENKHDAPLQPSLSSVLSVCGCAAVRSHVRNELAVSLGCETSRDAGAIGRDRLVVSVPWGSIDALLDAAQQTQSTNPVAG
jgi:uncharacterized protein (DUF169 family)